MRHAELGYEDLHDFEDDILTGMFGTDANSFAAATSLEHRLDMELCRNVLGLPLLSRLEFAFSYLQELRQAWFDLSDTPPFYCIVLTL